MPAFIPTPEQRKQYADHTIELRESTQNTAHATVSGDHVVRWTYQVHRIPSERLFVVWVYQGATPKEVESIIRTAEALPRGEWARFPDHWFPGQYTRSGRKYHKQTRGLVADDPFAQLELEMLIDAESEVHA